MAYKYLNDNGLKAYTKKVKGALKDLHTPIAISTENTTESKAQNVRNMADFVAKAKAAGIADVNGMAVTCTIRDEYFGVGYFGNIGTGFICGIVSFDDVSNPYTFAVDNFGEYTENEVLTATAANLVNSAMLNEGARKPIILTPSTTEVDEETYQKLLSDDVDVVFKDEEESFAYVFEKTTNKTNLYISFSQMVPSEDTLQAADYMLTKKKVEINKNNPHEVSISYNGSSLDEILDISGYLSRRILSPVLQQIDLTGTDAQRKAKLDKFKADWKALTGVDDLNGARFVGITDDENTPPAKYVFTFDPNNNAYWGLSAGSEDDDVVRKIYVDCIDGTIYITPLFSHLEPVEIFTDNSVASKQKNIDNLNAYKSNLTELGVDTSISFQVIFQNGNGEYFGNLYNSGGGNTYIGLIFTVDDNSVSWMRIKADGEVVFVNLASEDAIKYSYTPVPLTTTTSTNKTQLDLFLSKVPNAQVMHCIYKDVYAGTLHKINGNWYGVLVGESNTIAGQLSIKLQADGTIVEGAA